MCVRAACVHSRARPAVEVNVCGKSAVPRLVSKSFSPYRTDAPFLLRGRLASADLRRGPPPPGAGQWRTWRTTNFCSRSCSWGTPVWARPAWCDDLLRCDSLDVPPVGYSGPLSFSLSFPVTGYENLEESSPRELVVEREAFSWDPPPTFPLAYTEFMHERISQKRWKVRYLCIVEMMSSTYVERYFEADPPWFICLRWVLFDASYFQFMSAYLPQNFLKFISIERSLRDDSLKTLVISCNRMHY